MIAFVSNEVEGRWELALLTISDRKERTNFPEINVIIP